MKDADVSTKIVVKIDKFGVTETKFEGKHLAKHILHRILMAVKLGHRATILQYRSDLKTLKRKSNKLKADEAKKLSLAKELQAKNEADVLELKAARELVALNK